MTELKPCPFCGGKADWFVLEKMNNEKLYYVECSYCFARTGYYFTEYESIKEWNKRTPDWISVNKRLPEESGDYLVFVEGLIENMMYFKRHSAWNATDLNCHKNYEITTVTHWLPLPEPPEQEAE